MDPSVSGRALALRYEVGRNTVAEALKTPMPKGRKKPPPRASVLEPVKGFIDAMLRADADGPRKPGLTPHRPVNHPLFMRNEASGLEGHGYGGR